MDAQPTRIAVSPSKAATWNWRQRCIVEKYEVSTAAAIVAPKRYQSSRMRTCHEIARRRLGYQFFAGFPKYTRMLIHIFF